MKNKKIFLIIFLLILVILFCGISLAIKLNNTKIKKEKENIQDIFFSPYSNENGLIVLVEAEDDEYGIKKVNYFDQNNQRKEIYCYGKNKIALDYKIEEQGEYKFSFENQNGDVIEKTLVIDENYEQKLIDINIKADKELGTEVEVTINYNVSLNSIFLYKIGNKEEEWKNYNGTFKVTSYDVLDGNLQNEDNKTVVIYAKAEDNANNKIIISKNIINLDLDIPEKPDIKIIKSDDYATITSDGILLNSEVEIEYDKREDITNYYSIDQGKTWIEYNGKISGLKNWRIYAKSVKNKTGLESVSIKEANPANINAIGVSAYDGDDTTSFTTKSSAYINIDNSVIGKNIKVKIDLGSWAEYKGSLKLLNKDNSVIYSEAASTGVHTIKIIDGTVKLQFIPYNAWGEPDKLIEIYLEDEPKININHSYPKMTLNEVEQYYATATINYLENCIEKLYKINDGEWKDYINDSILLNIGDIIYAKGVNQLGYETNISQYNVKIPDDAIGPEAYDGDDATSFTTKSAAYINIDNSVIGKNIKVKIDLGYSPEYKGSLKLLNKDNSVLYSEDASTGVHTIKIIDGTSKLQFTPYNAWGEPDKLIEIYLEDEPKININHSYPKMTLNEVEQYYATATINYLENCIEKLYKINDGEWKDYINDSILLNIGDIIYAKGVNQLGYETNISQYNVKIPDDAIGPKAYDGDDTTSFTTKSAAYMNIDDSVVGKNIKVKIKLSDSYYKGSLKLLNKDNSVIYSEAASTGVHIIKILDGTSKLQFTPYNAWGELDKLIEISLEN